MKIQHVTLTGADDNTSIEEMYRLSAKYPFVEWGVLFSRAKSGVERYPSDEWVQDLKKLGGLGTLNLSAHLCGGYVKDAFKGVITFLEDEGMDETFGRIQLNCYKQRLKQAFENENVWRAMKRAHRPVILGGNYSGLQVPSDKFETNTVSPLFDASGGHGDSPREWPKSIQNLFCGYAGGLGPENIDEELHRIEDVVGDKHVWIDMESKVRTGGNFDLKKCEVVLQAVESWIG